MKKNRFIFSQNPFEKGTKDKLLKENEALRATLKTLSGSELRVEKGDLPPEIENRVLKSILELEAGYSSAPLVTVYELLGSPSYAPVNELTDEEVEVALERLERLFFDHNILLDFGDPANSREKYTYITEAFFPEKIRNIQMPAFFSRFRVNPERVINDPDGAIREVGQRFLNGWFNRQMNEVEALLGKEIILENGSVLSREQVLEKFRLMFESFTEFRNWEYSFNEVKHELKGEDGQGVGLVSGYVRYEVVLESGERQQFEGPFILFMSLSGNSCRIFYFVCPGFKW